MSRNHLRHSAKANLSRNLSRVPQVADALNMVGQALIALASALKSEGSVSSNGLHPLPSLPELPTPAPDNCTVTELINDFLKAKARQNRSDRYLRAMRVSLGSFARGRRHLPAGSITVSDLEKWLDSQRWKARTRLGYLLDVRTMYNWGIKRNLVAANPAAAVDAPALEQTPVIVHQPAEVRAVLEFARGYDLNICRALAIRYFSGLRSAEAGRLVEADIKTECIEVHAVNSKTRARRPVEVLPNLRAWLELGGDVQIHDQSNRWRWFTAALKKKTGVDWPHNVTRHSFCSYHLAHFQNAARTALEAGHSETMLFKHYRQVVTKEAAAEFWAIVPGLTSNILPNSSATAPPGRSG